MKLVDDARLGVGMQAIAEAVVLGEKAGSIVDGCSKCWRKPL